MVPRLRVAVRVVSEDEYLAHLAQGPPGPGLYRGEKKFPIIISNPQLWQIGHLAVEIKKQYKQIYGRDVGAIKYISHGFDDCQLHKDLSIYEHLYDEGRARTDPSDQYVVVKAIYSQGRPLREGSVVPDFDDPRFEHRPIPPLPVPSWSRASLISGKRSADEDDDRDTELDNLRSKRPRLDDNPESGSDESIAQTIERQVPVSNAETTLPHSPVVIQDSQSSPRNEPAQLVRKAAHNGASSRISLPATGSKVEDTSDTATDLSFPKSYGQLLYDAGLGKSQPLLTPPSDASKKASAKASTGHAKGSSTYGLKRKSSAVHASASGLGRSGAFKKDVYEMEDVDDSQMSPPSKLATFQKSPKERPASRNSHDRKEKSSSRRFRGNVPMKDITSIMEGGRNMLPASPDRTFVGGRDADNREENTLHIRRASVSAANVPYKIAVPPQGKEPSADSQSTSAPSERNEQPESQLSDGLVDADMEGDLSTPFGKHIDVKQRHDKTKAAATAIPAKLVVSEGGDQTTPSHKETVDSQGTQGKAKKKRTRKKKSEVNPTDIAASIATDASRLEDTKLSTPMDSAGEQLLEMQASSQKSRQDSMKETKQVKKQAKNQLESQAKLKAADKKKRRASKASEQAHSAQALPKPASQSSQEPDAPSSVPKSPYARESPPKGSIGLGFTNSPRRPSTSSVETASSSQRKLFQDKSAPKEFAQSDALKDNDSLSDDDDDESSGSTVTTPSKQARPTEAQTVGKEATERARPAPQPSDSSGSDSSRSVSVALPAGMTFERYEALRKSHEAKIASRKEVPKPKGAKQQVTKAEKKAVSEDKETMNGTKDSLQEFAQLAKALSKESASSAAVSEQSKPRRKAKKKESLREEFTAENRTITGIAVTAEQSEQNEPPKKAAKAARTPSTTASEASGHPSQSLSAKPTQGAIAPPANKTSAASKQTTTEPKTGVQKLREKIAAKGTKPPLIPSSFALPVPLNPKKLALEDEESEEDDSSSSEDDLDRKGAELIATSRPDASTRTALADSDSDDENEEDDSDN